MGVRFPARDVHRRAEIGRGVPLEEPDSPYPWQLRLEAREVLLRSEPADAEDGGDAIAHVEPAAPSPPASDGRDAIHLRDKRVGHQRDSHVAHDRGAASTPIDGYVTAT